MPKTLHIKTFGCQMNEYDSERMAEALEAGGYVRTADAADADLVILVPCYRRFTDHRAVLLDFAADHGVPVIDMEKAIDALGVPRTELFADDSHPTAALHAQYGALLCEALVERLKERD